MRKALTFCLLLAVVTGVSARVRVSAYEDPRSSKDIVLAIDDEGYLYLVEETGWVKINEEPCPTAGPYDLDTFYDDSIDDIVMLVVDGEGRVYAGGVGKWLPITGVPDETKAPYHISAFYYNEENTTLLTLLDAGGQLLAWYHAEEYYKAVAEPLPASGDYSFADYFEQGDDSYQLHAVDSSGAIYTFLADGWHEYPVAVEGEPPYQLVILYTSAGMIEFIVDASGEISFVKDAEKVGIQSATLDGKPPYDFDVAHTPGTDDYRSYLVDSEGTLFSYDGENWLQVLGGLPE